MRVTTSLARLRLLWHPSTTSLLHPGEQPIVSLTILAIPGISTPGSTSVVVPVPFKAALFIFFSVTSVQ